VIGFDHTHNSSPSWTRGILSFPSVCLLKNRLFHKQEKTGTFHDAVPEWMIFLDFEISLYHLEKPLSSMAGDNPAIIGVRMTIRRPWIQLKNIVRWKVTAIVASQHRSSERSSVALWGYTIRKTI
jgi:hypothetical protein